MYDCIYIGALNRSVYFNMKQASDDILCHEALNHLFTSIRVNLNVIVMEFSMVINTVIENLTLCETYIFLIFLYFQYKEHNLEEIRWSFQGYI